MSHDDHIRILSAARRLREREGPGFPVSLLARPAGMSRATLYRRLGADEGLARELSQIRTEGVIQPKEALLSAATKLLAEQGIAGLTMEGVAERAGLSAATLYRHFDDRDALVREVLRGSLSVLPVQRKLEQDSPLEETLVSFVDAAISRLQKQPHLLRLLAFANDEEASELSRLRRDEERLSSAVVAFFERHHAELCAARPEQLAASLMGQVLGAVLFGRLRRTGETPDATTIVRVFLRGACATPEPKEEMHNDEQI